MKTKNDNATLFPRQLPLRDSRGRFCTREMAIVDKTRRRNAVLEYERDKYMRMYIAVARDNERLTRELCDIREQLDDISRRTYGH